MGADSYAAIHALATQPCLHRHYEGQEVGGADRAAEGFGDGGEKQQDGEQVFWVAGQVDRAGLMPARDRVSNAPQPT